MCLYPWGLPGAKSRCLEIPFGLTNDIPFPLFLLRNRTSVGQRLLEEWGQRNDGSNRVFYDTGPGRWHANYRRDGKNRLNQRRFWVGGEEPQRRSSLGRKKRSDRSFRTSNMLVTITGIFWPFKFRQFGRGLKLYDLTTLKFHPPFRSSEEALSICPK